MCHYTISHWDISDSGSSFILAHRGNILRYNDKSYKKLSNLPYIAV